MIVSYTSASDLKETSQSILIDFFLKIQSQDADERFIKRHPFLSKITEPTIFRFDRDPQTFMCGDKTVFVIPVGFSYGNSVINDPEMEKIFPVLEQVLEKVKARNEDTIAIDIGNLVSPTKKHMFWRNYFAEHELKFEIYE